MELVVNTFLPQESANSLFEFERFRALFLSEEEAVTHELYLPNNYIAKEALAISLAYFNGTPYAASSLFQREGFPASSARCVNRFFVLKDFRFGGVRYKDLKKNSLGQPRKPIVSVKMAQQQMIVAKQMGLDFCFFSREIPNNKWCDSLCSELNRQSEFLWVLKESVAAVCNPSALSCWQHILYSDLNKSSKTLQFTHESSAHEVLAKFKSQELT